MVSMYVAVKELLKVYTHAKQKHLECKKVQGQSEATLQTGRHNQKVWYQLRARSYFIKYLHLLEWHTIL